MIRIIYLIYKLLTRKKIMSSSVIITSINTDTSSIITGANYVDENGVAKTLPITADMLKDVTPSAGFSINFLDDGKVTFTTPELAIAVPATLTLVDALATIASEPTGIVYAGVTFASGIVVSVADLTAPVTINLAVVAA